MNNLIKYHASPVLHVFLVHGFLIGVAVQKLLKINAYRCQQEMNPVYLG